MRTPSSSDADDAQGAKKGKKSSLFLPLTLLQQALKLEPVVSVARERLDLRAVGRVVCDGPIQKPERVRQGLGRVFRRLHRADGARGRGDGLVEGLRRLRAERGHLGGVDAVDELFFGFIFVDCWLVD